MLFPPASVNQNPLALQIFILIYAVSRIQQSNPLAFYILDQYSADQIQTVFVFNLDIC